MSTDNLNNSEPRINDLVVVGSSAGGVGALSTLVSTLHKDFPAPLVFAQHLDPQRPSNLGPILERRTQLPIVVVGEGSPTPLESGKIYVVPSNRHVKISDGHVFLEGDHNDRPKPSVDLLLSSAAEFYGEHLIAVILTGAGSEGLREPSM
jgi:two-component system CheB/CheR fusion protein